MQTIKLASIVLGTLMLALITLTYPCTLLTTLCGPLGVYAATLTK